VLEGIPAVAGCEKPWGRFERYAHNEPCTVKVITVRPGATLSLQYHHNRDELWVFLDGGACARIGDETSFPEPGERLFVPRGTVHRLSGIGGGPARVLEVSFGLFDEEDIVRLEDAYGRDTGAPEAPGV